MKKGVYQSIAVLVGTVIGAGVLGIPYVVAKSGFLIGILHIFLIGLIILIMNLFIGEVALRTNGNHQISGYAEKYLGKFAKLLMTLAVAFWLYGALIAYLIGGSESLNAIFPGNVFYYFIGYFIVMAGLVFFGLNAIKRSEIFMGGILLFIVLIISVIGFTKLDFTNLQTVNLSYLLYPYGVILFALSGEVAIPEMKEILYKNRKSLKKAIIIGSLIPVVVYALFAFVVVGVTGINTTEIATLGLSNIFGWQITLFGNLFAFFAVSTGFLTLGLALVEMYNYDYGLNKKLSWFLSCVLPFLFLLFFWEKTGFRNVLNVTGIISGGVIFSLMVLIFFRAKKFGDRVPEYSIKKNYFLGVLIIVLFVLGVIFGL